MSTEYWIRSKNVRRLEVGVRGDTIVVAVILCLQEFIKINSYVPFVDQGQSQFLVDDLLWNSHKFAGIDFASTFEIQLTMGTPKIDRSFLPHILYDLYVAMNRHRLTNSFLVGTRDGEPPQIIVLSRRCVTSTMKWKVVYCASLFMSRLSTHHCFTFSVYEFDEYGIDIIFGGEQIKIR